jgi:hypothetical protein
VEIVDGGGGSRSLGQAGHGVTGSGGGGADGRYVFASLAELDGLISEWQALQARIKSRGEKLGRAIDLIAPPADDVMSRLQAAAAVASLQKAEEHRKAMEYYAAGYVKKLEAARTDYAVADMDGEAAVHRAGRE